LTKAEAGAASVNARKRENNNTPKNAESPGDLPFDYEAELRQKVRLRELKDFGGVISFLRHLSKSKEEH
jgi:hypothetical protein